MKTAITSLKACMDSEVDLQFGHCGCFVIYDSTNGSIEFLPNPYRENKEQAGLLAIQLLHGKNVQKIISGDFGQKVKPILDSHKIQMIILSNTNITIRKIIELLQEQSVKTT
jgi:predicted Fe-Mo cluster-binding NifX family protein